MIKALLIAPRHEAMPLRYMDAEVQAIQNSGLDVTAHWGDISATEFAEYMQNSEQELLFLITHGTSQGIMLSDGMLTAEMLVNAIGNQFEVVFLNTCAGLEIAQLIQKECGAGVICTVGEIDDRQAFFTGSLFAKELARNKTYFDAYKRSQLGHRSYMFLAGQTSMREIKQVLSEELQRFEERMEKRFKALEQRINIQSHDYSQWVIIGMIAVVFLLALAVGWGVYTIANPGGI